MRGRQCVFATALLVAVVSWPFEAEGYDTAFQDEMVLDVTVLEPASVASPVFRAYLGTNRKKRFNELARKIRNGFAESSTFRVMRVKGDQSAEDLSCLEGPYTADESSVRYFAAAQTPLEMLLGASLVPKKLQRLNLWRRLPARQSCSIVRIVVIIAEAYASGVVALDDRGFSTETVNTCASPIPAYSQLARIARNNRVKFLLISNNSNNLSHWRQYFGTKNDLLLTEVNDFNSYDDKVAAFIRSRAVVSVRENGHRIPDVPEDPNSPRTAHRAPVRRKMRLWERAKP